MANSHPDHPNFTPTIHHYNRDHNVLHRNRPQASKSNIYYPAHNGFILQPRAILNRHTVVKVDSQAGATGTSVAQLPGRHLLVSPWFAMSVWGMLLVFVVLTFAGFILAYQARKEFRMRVREQAKVQPLDIQHAHETTEYKIPITRKEYKSFTRKSIMVLNSNTEKNSPTYRVSVAGELLPINPFDRPTRDSVLIAEIRPHSGGFTNDDPFHEYSRQFAHEGFWDRASRKSKVLSVANFSSFSPSLQRKKTNPFTALELLDEDFSNQNSPTSRPTRRHPTAQNPGLRVRDHQDDARRFLPPLPKLANETIQLHRKAEDPASNFSLSKSQHSLPITDANRSTSNQDTSQDLTLHSPVVESIGTLSYTKKNTSSPSKSIGTDRGSELSFSQSTSSGQDQTQRSIMLSSELPDSLMAIISPLDSCARSPSPLEALPPICPDNAVAQYASTRSSTPTSAAKLSRSGSANKSGSVLDLFRRSLNSRRLSATGRESPMSTSLTALPELKFDDHHDELKRNEETSLPSPTREFCHKPLTFTHSIIFEEDEDCGGSIKGRRPMTPVTSRFDTTSSFGSNSHSSTTQVPQPVAMNGTRRGINRARSHTVASGLSSMASDITISDTYSVGSQNGSSIARSASTSGYSSFHRRNNLSHRNSVITRTAHKKKSSLSTYQSQISRSKNSSVDFTPHSRHHNPPFPSSSRQYSTTTTTISRPSNTLQRNTSDPSQVIHNPQQPLPTRRARTALAIRRTDSAQARIPLSGTMSSGGVRDSSFVP